MDESAYPQSKSERLRFEGRDEAKVLVLTIAEQAKRQICIFGINIDQVLFNNEAFLDTISQLARRHAKTQIRILVHDTTINVQNDHRLIPIAQRLTSSIHIHNTAKQHRSLNKTQLLVDDFAYLTCPLATQYNGHACLYDRLDVRQFQQEFDTMWAQSTPDISVRRLHL